MPNPEQGPAWQLYESCCSSGQTNPQVRQRSGQPAKTSDKSSRRQPCLRTCLSLRTEGKLCAGALSATPRYGLRERVQTISSIPGLTHCRCLSSSPPLQWIHVTRVRSPQPGGQGKEGPCWRQESLQAPVNLTGCCVRCTARSHSHLLLFPLLIFLSSLLQRSSRLL